MLKGLSVGSHIESIDHTSYHIKGIIRLGKSQIYICISVIS